MSSDHKSANNFLLLLSLFLIFLTSFFTFFSNQADKKNQIKTPLLSVTQEKEKTILGSNKRNYEAPTIFVSGGEGYGSGGVIPLASTDEPAVYLASYSYSGEAEISVYRGDQQALLDYLTHDKDNVQLKKRPQIEKYNLITTIKQNIGTGGYDNTVKIALPLEENGIWFLQIKTAKGEEYSFVVRSDFGVLAKEGDNRLVFWAQSFQTKRKVGGGRIKAYNLLEKPTILEETTFDGDGIASLVLNPNIDIAIAEFENKQALIPINLRYLDSYNYRSFIAKEIASRYFVFTDRPVYQPGDTVYFKAIIRDDDDARYALPQGTAKIKIYRDWDEKNNVVYETTQAITNTGSVYGEYKIPQDATPGDYQLKIDTGKDNSNRNWLDFGSNCVSFQVQYYRKPEYTINIETSQKEIIAKNELKFTVKGNYFSGQPLSGQVKYSISTADFASYEYFSDYSFLGDEDYYWWSYGNKMLSEEVATFDEKGEANINLKAESKESDGKNKIFTIEAQYDDGSGNPAFARKNVLVYAGEFDIFRKDYGFGNQVNKEIAIPLILKPHFNGKISQIPLKVKIHRENWVPKWSKEEKYPTYEKEKEDFSEMNLVTDNNGEATIKFLPIKDGSYVFTVEATDNQGNIVKKDFYTWVSDKDYSYNYDQYQNQLTVKSDKTKYKPGETAILAIHSEIPDRDVFLSLERGRMDRFQIVSLNGKSALVQVPLLATDLPNIYARVSSFSDFTLDGSSTNVSISTESKKIVVNLIPNREIYGPADTVVLDVQTKDTAGNPVPSEVAVWAVDKALFELVDQKPGKIFETFWKERWDDTQEAHSLQGIIVPNAEAGGCFSGETKILLADGKQKPISEIKVGEYILTKESEKSSQFVKAKVQGIHQAEATGYLIINGKLKVTENHFLWVDSGWKQAGSLQVGDKLLDKDGQIVEVSSLEWIRGKFTVYNLEVEKYHTFFAEEIFVHNQKGGGSRTIFKDTAYWNPAVQTDNEGKARLTFRLPDNLTTWVIAGIAASNETKVGQSTKEIVVSKNIIVRPILPNILRIGDQLSVSALVQNFTEADQNFAVRLDFDSGIVKEPQVTNVLIKSKETKQISWQIEPQKENGKAKLFFSAVSKENQENSDKVTSEIPVIPFGYKQKIGATGEGNKEYEIKLSNDVDKSKSKIDLYLSSNLHGSLLSSIKYLLYYPYGCVEQTTSAFVPAVVVKENLGLFKDYLGDQDLDKIIKASIKRLAKLQGPDGSWGWWSTKDSSIFVTAYVVEYLSRAKRLGYDDQQTLSKARYYLETRNYDSANREEKIAQAYGLSFFDNVNQKGILLNLRDPKLTPDILSFAVIAKIKSGDKDPNSNGLNQLISLAKSQGDKIYFEKGSQENFGSIDASTALAIRAMIMGGADRALIGKAVRFLIQNRRYDYWGNTFGTAQAIEAISAYATSEKENVPNYFFTVTLDGEVLKSGKVSDTKAVVGQLSIPSSLIKDSGSRIVINKQGDGQIYSTLIVEEWHTDKNAQAESHGLTVKREYFDEDQNLYQTIGVGDEVLVKLTVSGLRTEEKFAVLTDELPSGLVPINEAFKNEQFSRASSDLNCYVSTITQNGVVLSFYRLKEGENICFYRARAVTQGKFLVPPAEASLMYSPEIWGRSSAGTVVVEGSKKVIPVVSKPSTPPAKAGYQLGIILSCLAFIIGWRFFIKRKNKKPPANDSVLPPPISPSV